MERRSSYTPLARPEEFIVPLLRREIAASLERVRRELVDSGKELRALDFGCGAQPLRAQLIEAGFSYTSADVAQNSAKSVDVLCCIDRDLPEALLDRGPFTLIVCTEVLEHVLDWCSAFSNFVKLLRPGGYVLITTPHVYQLHEEPFDFWRPTVHAVRSFARDSGLALVVDRAAGDGCDVLGTVLSNITFRPQTRSFWPRAIALGCRLASSALFALLKTRRLQRFIKGDGPLYLSNVALLQKPDALGETAPLEAS